MGPGSFDPGNSAATAAPVAALLASMGPGSFDPGNAFHAAMPSASTRRLQWGRGLLTPEMHPIHRLRSLPPRFNGAGVF